MVERNLAKVEVASSSLVVRSERVSADPSNNGGLAERRGNGLQSRVHGFKSRLHLGVRPRAIGAAGARFLDTEEVTGSNPVSPTKFPQVRGGFRTFIMARGTFGELMFPMFPGTRRPCVESCRPFSRAMLSPLAARARDALRQALRNAAAGRSRTIATPTAPSAAARPGGPRRPTGSACNPRPCARQC